MTVTIISCYYIIRSKFPTEKYLRWIKNYLAVGFKDFH